MFVCENDLWVVSVKEGIAHRLTSNLGRISHCSISPDGGYVAFTGREEGNKVPKFGKKPILKLPG